MNEWMNERMNEWNLVNLTLFFLPIVNNNFIIKLKIMKIKIKFTLPKMSE